VLKTPHTKRKRVAVKISRFEIMISAAIAATISIVAIGRWYEGRNGIAIADKNENDLDKYDTIKHLGRAVEI
jgi:hypothetical protein